MERTFCGSIIRHSWARRLAAAAIRTIWEIQEVVHIDIILYFHMCIVQDKQLNSLFWDLL